MRYSKGIISVIAIIIIAAFLLTFSLSIPKTIGASDTVIMQVTISNSPPGIGTITCTPSPLTPTAGSNTTVSCSAVITDTNGYGDVNTSRINATLFYEVKHTTDDLNEHYSNGSYSQAASPCIFYSSSGTTTTVQCNFTTRFFINPGAWDVNFTIADIAAANVSNQTALTVNPVLGISITETSIDFGSLALGATSAEKNTTIANLGNYNMDVNLSTESGTLDCPAPYSDITTNGGATGLRYNVTNPLTFTNGVEITGSQAIYPEFNLKYYNATTTTDGSTTDTITWVLKLPSTGIGGTCNSTTTITTTVDVAPLCT